MLHVLAVNTDFTQRHTLQCLEFLIEACDDDDKLRETDEVRNHPPRAFLLHFQTLGFRILLLARASFLAVQIMCGLYPLLVWLICLLSHGAVPAAVWKDAF